MLSLQENSRHSFFSHDFLLQFVALFTPICKCNVQESLGRTSACSLYACLHRLVWIILDPFGSRFREQWTILLFLPADGTGNLDGIVIRQKWQWLGHRDHGNRNRFPAQSGKGKISLDIFADCGLMIPHPIDRCWSLISLLWLLRQDMVVIFLIYFWYDNIWDSTGMYRHVHIVLHGLWMPLDDSLWLDQVVQPSTQVWLLCCYTLRGLKDLSGGFRILQIQHKKTLPVRSFRNFQKLSSLFSLFSPWTTPLPFTIWGAWPLQAKRNLTRIQREIAGRTQGVELTYVDVQYAEAQTAVAAVADNIDNIWRGYGRCIVLDCAGLHWIAVCGLQILADMCDMWDFRQWLLNRGSPSWSSWPHGAPLDISCAVSHMLCMLRATFPNIFRTWLLHSSFFFIDLLYCAGLGFTWVFWLRAWWQIASSSVGDDIWPWRAMAMTFNDPTGDLTVTETIPGKGGAPGTSATTWVQNLESTASARTAHHGTTAGTFSGTALESPVLLMVWSFGAQALSGFALFFFVSTHDHGNSWRVSWPFLAICHGLTSGLEQCIKDLTCLEPFWMWHWRTLCLLICWLVSLCLSILFPAQDDTGKGNKRACEYSMWLQPKGPASI